MSKRKFNSPSEKVKIVKCVEENQYLSSRKLEEKHAFKHWSNKSELYWLTGSAAKPFFLKKNGDLKNSKISTMLTNVGFVWQGKR